MAESMDVGVIGDAMARPAPEGHPQYEALKQRFQPLLVQLEDIANARGDAQTSSYKALQELLKQLNTLDQS